MEEGRKGEMNVGIKEGGKEGREKERNEEKKEDTREEGKGYIKYGGKEERVYGWTDGQMYYMKEGRKKDCTV